MAPGSVSASELASQLKYQRIPQPWTFTIPASPVNKQKFLEKLASHKALMVFHNDVPNSHIPAFLEYLVNALLTATHSKSASKSYM